MLFKHYSITSVFVFLLHIDTITFATSNNINNNTLQVLFESNTINPRHILDVLFVLFYPLKFNMVS